VGGGIPDFGNGVRELAASGSTLHSAGNHVGNWNDPSKWTDDKCQAAYDELKAQIKAAGGIAIGIAAVDTTCEDWSVEYKGKCYAVLPKTLPGTGVSTKARGCHSGFLPLPAGYQLVDYSDDIQTNVASQHQFGTYRVVYSNGKAYGTGTNGNCGRCDCTYCEIDDWLTEENGQYKVSKCDPWSQVFIAKGDKTVDKTVAKKDKTVDKTVVQDTDPALQPVPSAPRNPQIDPAPQPGRAVVAVTPNAVCFNPESYALRVIPTTTIGGDDSKECETYCEEDSHCVAFAFVTPEQTSDKCAAWRDKCFMYKRAGNGETCQLGHHTCFQMDTMAE